MGGLRWLAGLGLSFALLAGSAAQAEIRAVLVGVGRYVGPDVPSLQGPKNDLAAMSRLLAAQGASDVVALQDEAVTRSSVREAVAAVGRRAKPGDWVIFYYSGHGSQAKARDRSEEDGLDEFLLLGGFDHTRPNPETFIVDNDLNAWLATLLPATVNVLQIADSCHSGTLNRSYEAPTNFVAREARPQGPAFVLPATGETARAGATQRNLVYIGASQDDQFALEAPMPGAASDSRGLLTYSLEQALQDRRADGGLTADSDGDGELSFAELAGVLEVRTRELSRARQWASVRVPAGNEATAVFRPLRPRAEALPIMSVAAADQAAEKLLAGGGDWRLAEEGQAADLLWRAETGEVFDAQGDRIAEAIGGREAFAGVADKRQALSRLYAMARETTVKVEIGPRRRGERYRPGEPVSLAVSSRSPAGYLTAFNLAGDGTVQRLYPLEGDGDGRFTRQQALARTHAAAPFGADHVVALVTPVEPRALRAALARMDGRRQASAAAEAVRDAAVGSAQLALGELHTGQ